MKESGYVICVCPRCLKQLGMERSWSGDPWETTQCYDHDDGLSFVGVFVAVDRLPLGERAQHTMGDLADEQEREHWRVVERVASARLEANEQHRRELEAAQKRLRALGRTQRS